MSDPTISVQDTSNLVLQIRELLKGIDECEIDTDDGWWETSVGAEFGRKKLEELIALVETKMQWVGFIDE